MPLEDVRDHFIVVASRSHLSPETETYIADLKKKHGSVELISSGSSIKICLVAEGRLMCIRVSLRRWSGIQLPGMR